MESEKGLRIDKMNRDYRLKGRRRDGTWGNLSPGETDAGSADLLDSVAFEDRYTAQTEGGGRGSRGKKDSALWWGQNHQNWLQFYLSWTFNLASTGFEGGRKALKDSWGAGWLINHGSG